MVLKFRQMIQTFNKDTKIQALFSYNNKLKWISEQRCTSKSLSSYSSVTQESYCMQGQGKGRDDCCGTVHLSVQFWCEQGGVVKRDLQGPHE